MSSVLGLAARGLGELFQGVGLAGKYASKGIGKAVVNDITKAHPWRYGSSAAALGGATALAGFGGIGPMSSLGDMFSKNMIAEYGDRPDTQKVINATQTSATLGAMVLGTVGAAGAVGYGPLALNYSGRAKQFAQGFRGLGKGFSPMNREVNATKDLVLFGKGLLSGKTPEEFVDQTAKKAAIDARGKGARRGARYRAKRNEVIEDAEYNILPAYTAGYKARQAFKDPKKFVTSPDRSYMKHPILWGTGLGGLAGVSAAVTQDQYKQSRGGFEGDIQGISSSQGGGISRDLQDSTQGLMFSLHKLNRSTRSRYQ